MSQDIVVRRFEVHARGQGALDEVDVALPKAVLPDRSTVKAERSTRLRRPPMLIVRLQGAAAAIARSAGQRCKCPWRASPSGLARRPGR